ncbi:MAG: protein-methionine-sulfoxide reductase heme-binding subunit MsrQ [Spongiibacteraceae bacterium]
MLLIVKLCIWIAALSPLSWMIYLGVDNQLGPDPGKALVDGLGLWALRLLLITLLLRPLRDITKQLIFVRVRRLVGLFCFFYATLHFAASIFYVVGYSWAELAKAMSDKTYIVLGFGAWLLLFALAATSNRWSQRKLGGGWLSLHRLIYVAAILVCLHFVWLVRSDFWQPVMYFLLAALLLVWRVPIIGRSMVCRLRT